MTSCGPELKLEIRLKDARAIEIVENASEEKRDEIIEKLIILGDMVVSYASISVAKETLEEFLLKILTTNN